MAPDPRLDGWVDEMSSAGVHGLDLVAAVGRTVAHQLGLAVDDRAPALLRRGDVELTPSGPASPWTLGSVFERSLDLGHRHRMGVHYTPPAVASGLARVALEGAGPRVDVCDPAVGGGVFLLAAAEALARADLDRGTIVAEHLWGIDIDPDAVAVAELTLALWGSTAGEWVTPGDHLVRADTLDAGSGAFAGRNDGFGVVLGNPPFQSQLGADTARSVEAGQRLRRRWAVEAGPYADTAAFFLLAALELAADGGVVVLVEPQSVLVAADAAPIRARVRQQARLEGLWTADRGIFDADVRVCAPVLRRAAPESRTVRRWEGRDVTPTKPAPSPPLEGSWAPLLADLLGVPAAAGESGALLGDTCTATAGFRDQFYGLVGHCVEADPGTGGDRGPAPGGARGAGAPLVTVGMIDPFHCRWGHGEFRFGKSRWRRPWIDVEALARDDPGLARWVRDRLTPKVLVATQTRVLEVVVDQTGHMVPSTPAIAVVPPPDRIWHVAAALSAPITAARAFACAGGAALSADTLRLSASQVLALPIPTRDDAWDEGAALAGEASAATDERSWSVALDRFGWVMCDAYGVSDADAPALVAWWRARIPRWRRD